MGPETLRLSVLKEFYLNGPDKYSQNEMNASPLSYRGYKRNCIKNSEMLSSDL